MSLSIKTKLSYVVLVATILLSPLIYDVGTAHADGGHSAAVEQWRYLVEQYDDWDVEAALRVIGCESEGRPTVWNYDGSGAHGLFQLLGWEWLAYKMFGVWDVEDPGVNVAVAHVIWRDGGRRFNTRIGWAASAACHRAN